MAFSNYRSESSYHTDELLATVDEIINHRKAVDLFSRDENVKLISALRGASVLGGERDRWTLTDAARTNVCAQIANNMINMRMYYAELHPKLQANGCFPVDFQTPKRLEDFMSMEAIAIDRLLTAYSLPRDYTQSRRPLHGLNLRVDSVTLPETARESKLRTLFEFLGVEVGEDRRLNLSLGGLGVGSSVVGGREGGSGLQPLSASRIPFGHGALTLRGEKWCG
ncbi:hypothetical protein B7494_g2384 [Chlorociboria aeruginascens]|nr:hypothetical protein B7494_g2384 [Chlorociboria aeruginascens]